MLARLACARRRAGCGARGLPISVATPECEGISHCEISISGRFGAFTCDEGGSVAKIDLVNRRVVSFNMAQHVYSQTLQADGNGNFSFNFSPTLFRSASSNLKNVQHSRSRSTMLLSSGAASAN